MEGTPLITVLMPVYNGEAYLREAVASILSQSCTDFEFLIIDDGSTDSSAQIIESYGDPRIRFLRNERNLGLIATLNRGLDLAKGEYIARMDCDDISMPERLSKQAAFMDAHPEIGVCGCWFRKFGSVEKVVRWQTDPAAIRCGLLFDSMVGHPTVMMRRSIIEKLNLRYDSAYRDAEDYELWARIAEHCDIANLGEVLLLYRVHPAQVTLSMAAGQRNTAGRVRLGQLGKLGIDPSPEEFLLHQAVSTCHIQGVQGLEDLFPRAEEWLCRLKDANDAFGVFPEPAFSTVLMERWLTFCKKAAEQGHWSTKTAYFPKLASKTGLGYRFVVAYLLRQLTGG